MNNYISVPICVLLSLCLKRRNFVLGHVRETEWTTRLRFQPGCGVERLGRLLVRPCGPVDAFGLLLRSGGISVRLDGELGIFLERGKND